MMHEERVYVYLGYGIWHGINLEYRALCFNVFMQNHQMFSRVEYLYAPSEIIIRQYLQ